MMRMRAKFALVMTSLVLFVVAVLSYMFAAQLLEQLIQETGKRASDLAEQSLPSGQARAGGSCAAGLAP